ncbi:MAG: hypothetical protein ABI678_25575, partial [Kofleriaceae bacterium]
AGKPPMPAFAEMKLELTKSGALRSFHLVEDGKTASATPTAGKLHVVAATPSDVPFPADGLIDGSFVSLMIPFLAHTKPNAITVVTAKQLAADGSLTDVSYTFDRTKTPIGLAIDGGGQKSTGTLALDPNGFPLRLEVTFAFGTIVIERG